MISTLVEAILGQRLMVVSLSVVLLVGGLYAFKVLNIEAYPDPSAPTIEVIAQNPGWSAEEMERQITVPIETQLNGMPGLDHIRSISLFGLSGHWFRLMSCATEQDFWTLRLEKVMILSRGTSFSAEG